MQKEFQGLRSQLYALSSNVSHLQTTLGKYAEARTTELNVSLAEIEGSVAELRSEAARLADVGRRFADHASRDDGPDAATRTALAEMEQSAAEVHKEITALHALRESLMEQIPQIVSAAVRDALLQAAVVAGLVPPSAAPAPGAPAGGHPEPPGAQAPAPPGVAAGAAAAPAARTAPGVPSGAPSAGVQPLQPAGAGIEEPVTLVEPSSPALEPNRQEAAVGAAAPADAGAADGGVIVEPAPPVAGAESAEVALGEVTPGEGPRDDSPEGELREAQTEDAAPREVQASSPEGAELSVGDSPVCVLPGLRVGPSLASGVTGALALARLRHRRRQRANPPAPGMRRRDRLTGPLTGGLEKFAVVRGLGTSNGKVVASRETTVRPGLLPVAERQGEEVSVDLEAYQPLVLLGADAPDVARALVASLLVLNQPSRAATIVVGDLLPGVPGFPAFGHTPVLASVVPGLVAELDRRARLVDEAGVTDVGGYRTMHPEAIVPFLLVATQEAPPADDPRWRRVIRDGSRLGVGIVVVGQPVEGAATIRLRGGGTVAEATPADLAERLAAASMFSLAPDAANEVLSVLVSARTDKDHPQLTHDDEDEPFIVEQQPDEPRVRVDLLGTYMIDIGGEELRSGLRAKARELLAFYLLHPSGTTLDAATEALWPEADPRRGSEWFWTALGNLRSRLRATVGDSQLKVIERDGDRYRIEPLFGVDVWRFQQALSEASASADDADREAALDRAAAAYGGELLAGFKWPWAEVPREDLRRRAVDVLVTLADIRWKAGNTAGAWEALERAIEIDPFAEQVYRRVMRLHARLSRPHEASETYRTLEARLAEVNLEPTAASQSLLNELCGAET